jgi:hypothetical protein
MRLGVQFFLIALRDLGAYTVRSGRWWLPLLLVTLGVVLAAAAATQAVVPTAVYTLF